MDFITSFLEAVIPFVVVISVLVYFHELGHYFVARRFGVKVEAFAIGFGPELFGWTNKHGTRWKVCLIPLGGYVKPLVDEDYEKDPSSKKPIANSLSAQSPLKRIAVALAGPVANYLLAIVIFTGVFVIAGQKVPEGTIEIRNVLEGSAAQKAGLEAQDVIESIDGQGALDLPSFQKIVQAHADKTVVLTVRRAGATQEIKVIPEPVVGSEGTTEGRIGAELLPAVKTVQHSFLGAIWAASKNVVNLTVVTVQLLGEIVTGERSADGLMGPIGIGKVAKDFSQQGLLPLFTIMAFLSVNLGLINLFPIPMLDGGHVMFYLIELFRGKPANRRVQEIAYATGFALVMALIVFSTWNDLSRLKVVQFVVDLFS